MTKQSTRSFKSNALGHEFVMNISMRAYREPVIWNKNLSTNQLNFERHLIPNTSVCQILSLSGKRKHVHPQMRKRTLQSGENGLYF